MDKQEYYYNGDYVTVYSYVEGHENLVIVRNGDYGELKVANRSQLIKKEDSHKFKQAQKHADELRLITQKAQENIDKITSKVVDKALIELSSRLKFNAVFGKDVNGATAGWVVTVSDELKKLVKEEAPEIIEKEKDILT